MAAGLAVVTLGFLDVSGAQARPAAPERPSVACVDQTAGVAAAAEVAAACDAEVEILDERTETDEVFAQPDGSTTLRRYAAPRRVRQGAGWVDVDADLAFQPDGSVRPNAVPYGLSFSGGGTGPFVAIAEGDQRLAQTWPTRLPRPTLDGATATYAEVLPGVDLELTATVEGYHQILVVKDRAAAANPALARIATRVTTSGGLSLNDGPGGRLDAVTAAGKKVFFSEAPVMWDAPRKVRVDGLSVALPRQERVMGVDVQGDQLVVTPDQAMLQAPSTTYPVRIDPTVYRYSGSNWTTVRSCASTTSYWTSKRDAMRVGNDPAQTSCRHRLLVNIPLNDLHGKLIKQSSFFANMDHSSPCGSPTPQVRLSVSTERWVTQGNTAVTWNNTDNYNAFRAWVVGTASPNSANEGRNANGSWTCGADLGDKTVEWGIDPGNFGWFTNRPEYSHITFMIYSTAENDWSTWKKFYPDSTYAEVTYNDPPHAPAPQSISDCSVRCSSPAVVSRVDPELRATASDPNGGNLNLYFTVQRADGTHLVTSPAVAQASGGTPAPWRIHPGLPGEGNYRWSVNACDEWGDCAGSGWFDFSVDTTPPPAPNVGPVDPNRYFREDGTGRSSGGIGVPGQLVLTGDASVDTFTWQLDGKGTPITVPATGTSTRTATITVTPQADFIRSLSVTAKDISGRTSSATYRFRVAGPDPEAGYWNLNGNALDSRDLSGRPGAIRHDGTVNGSTWVDVTVPGTVQSPRFRGAYFDGAAGSAAAITTAQPVLATMRNPDNPEVPRSFTVAAWVRFDGAVTDGRYYTAVSQQGVNKSGFELGYQTYPDSNFCFTMFASDTVGPPATRACVTTPVTTGEWVHLAGVYDDVDHTLRVYVHRLNAAGFVDLDNAVMADKPFTSGWSAVGPFTIGRAYNGAPGAPFKGVVDEVYAAQYAATAEDVQVRATIFEISE